MILVHTQLTNKNTHRQVRLFALRPFLWRGHKKDKHPITEPQRLHDNEDIMHTIHKNQPSKVRR